MFLRRSALQSFRCLSYTQSSRQSSISNYIQKFTPNENFTLVNNSTNQAIDGSSPISSYAGTAVKVVSDNNDENLIVVLPENSSNINNQQLPVESIAGELMTLLQAQNQNLVLQNQLSNIESKVSQIDQQLEPLEQKYESMVQASKSASDTRLLAFLGTWTISVMSIARLTWWEYSWDIMEPVAWFVTASGGLFWGWYYYITKAENMMTDIQDRIRNKKFRTQLQKQDFSIEKYNNLVLQRKALEKEFDKLQRRADIS